MTNIKLEKAEGLNFLSKLPDNSVDLILTDPPYITSQDSGMDRWVKHVEKQNKPDSVNVKTEEDWIKYVFSKDWGKFFENANIVDKGKACKRMREDYLKYGSIYGEKYAVQTDFGDWDAQFSLDKLQAFVLEFYRVLKKGGTAIVFFDLWKISDLKNMYDSCGFKQIRFIEWVKTNPQPRNSNINYLTNCREIALTAVKHSKPTFNSTYDNGIYNYPFYSRKDRFHPTQKSLTLFEDLILKHSNEGDLVVDPFLGSGTTAIAAKRTNRSFSGCEIDTTFFEKSVERIEKS